MDKIKKAEDTIKLLKDYIEVEKTSKKVLTATPKATLNELQEVIIQDCFENLEIIKKGE